MIVDDIDHDGIATCRTKADAPEIDGNLFIDEGAERTLSVGRPCHALKSMRPGEYDLWGRIVL